MGKFYTADRVKVLWKASEDDGKARVGMLVILVGVKEENLT